MKFLFENERFRLRRWPPMVREHGGADLARSGDRERHDGTMALIAQQRGRHCAERLYAWHERRWEIACPRLSAGMPAAGERILPRRADFYVRDDPACDRRESRC